MTTSDRRVMIAVVLCLQLLADVRGDSHDVLHHRDRVLEDVLVDLLVDVTHSSATLVVGG